MFILDKNTATSMISEKLNSGFGCEIKDATSQQLYFALCEVIKELMIKQRNRFIKKTKQEENKEVYYMSMEFLVGTSLRNNLYNLGISDVFKDVFKENDIDINDLYEMEPDAGLGNGGLGRLAACYLDSMTTLGIPATGFSIRYEFGIFRQKIVDGWQMEFPDNWLNKGDVWLKMRPDETYEVRFGGNVRDSFENGRYKAIYEGYETVNAVPYDMFISGYDSEAVNSLVLWSATSSKTMDMNLFSRGNYVKALEDNTMAEVISKVLYPADDHIEGKRLRLKQQYLLVSASLQSIVAKHLKNYKTLDNFADKVSIHINDTHPALCVPELMRILMDDNGYEWDAAWEICKNTLSYTNHTVMSEALERWDVNLFAQQLPRVNQIVHEINRRLVNELKKLYHDDMAKIEYMAVISNNQVKMANLCLACCHKINGVSALHSEILKTGIFKDFYYIYPERFTNVTNGIVTRRWLCQANPLLSDYITSLIGDGFKKDAYELLKLKEYSEDKAVLQKLSEIKRANKVRLYNYISDKNGIRVDPDSIFDVQIKRLHEYKRQLLNVLNILYMYNEIKDNPNVDFAPRTFVFAAKASAGYLMAKQIISLICAVADMVNSDPVVREKIKVVFLEDYKVSLAEIIIPAAEISEQISIAGKEASGTGNMKLMINGAVTLGTLDGANVEIREHVGDDNIVIFGADAKRAEEIQRAGYNPASYINENPKLKRIVDMLTSGILGKNYEDIAHDLWTRDVYMNLLDFASYVEAQKKVSDIYKDKDRFNRMSLINIAEAGVFSSDRAISEYAENIWKL